MSVARKCPYLLSNEQLQLVQRSKYLHINVQEFKFMSLNRPSTDCLYVLCVKVKAGRKVCVLFPEEHGDDMKVGEDICTFLRKELGEDMVIRQQPGKPELYVPESSWVVMVFSKQTLKDKVCKFRCIAQITDDFYENSLRVIPIVTDDVDIDDLPWFLNWITFLQKTDKNYLQRLLQIVTSKCM